MSFLGWMAVVGGLLLLVALSSAYLRRLPVSTAVLYLLLGIAFGPLGLGLLRVDLKESTPWLERLTELAVIVSLFVGGLKLRLHWRNPAWTAAYLLMGPVMLACIAGVALMARFFLGLDIASALLLGALLAPTDPVLASTVSVSNAADHDRMRYGLSGEAGLNDGMAFPFVIFGLLWAEHGGAGGWIGGWALHRLLWAVPAALLLGHLLGKSVGRLAVWLRSRHRDTSAPSDFLALALIALSYVGAEVVGAWGFLAVFAAGVGLRSAELKVVKENPHPEAPEPSDEVEGAPPHPPAEDLVSANVAAEALGEPAVAAGALVAETLSFGNTVERLLEILLVVLVGVSLAGHWDARAVPLALMLMIVLRPLAALLLLAGAPISWAQRWLMGWFGIRGIGSLYYLSYALNHAVSGRAAAELSSLTISVVTISILGHGITAQPFLAWYERVLARERG
ncbi:MAG TPA: cation:proton antiporter [Thermoanaerobaculia bacterium]|jgi:NhaP-type Na+/H+ or K+/H+ antiporter|nr:cation:proton antiporter [Thermoanaerobaculia bacterium]